MENRFAGAAGLGERRRRRLAQQDEDLLPGARTSVGTTPDDSTLATLADSDARLLRRAISPRLWKLVAALTGLLIGLSWLVWWQHSKFADVAAGRADLSRTTEGIAGVLLLLSAQLAMLIGWLRCRSDVDFQGRYRWWKWLAGGQACLAVLLLTGALPMVPGVVATVLEPLTGPIQAARNSIVLVPVVTFCLIVLGKVLPDMTRCFWSQALMIIAVLTTVVRFMLVSSAAQTPIHAVTLNAMLLASSFATFASMLLHSRFVAYVCNQPPQIPGQPATTAATDVAPDVPTADVSGPPESRDTAKPPLDVPPLAKVAKAATAPEATGAPDSANSMAKGKRSRSRSKSKRRNKAA